MKPISLKRIDQNNFIDCFHLKLKAEQEAFVSHPIRSLAQAYVYYHQCTPFGVYCGDVMVGYVMVIYDDEENTYNIWHLMIDKAQQGRGYGKAAVARCLDYIRTKPFGDSERVQLTCHEANKPALHIYRTFGFRETGNRDGEEIEMALNVK